MSLAPSDSISTPTPYWRTNATVLEVMAKFQDRWNAEQQLHIAPLSATEVDSPNSSAVSSVAQAVMRSADNIELVTAGDVAISTMAERSPSASRGAANRQETIQMQKVNGVDREGAGRGSGYLIDSLLPWRTFVDSHCGEQAANTVDTSDDGDVGCYSRIAESLTASSTVTVSPDRMERERLTSQTAGGGQRPRGRGRGRKPVIAHSASVSDDRDAAVGAQWMGTASQVGVRRIGRRGARSMTRQSFSCTEQHSSMEQIGGSWEQGKGTETNESGCAIIMYQPCEDSDPEQSVGVTEAEASEAEELQSAASQDQEFGSDVVHTRVTGDGHFQLTPSTPTQSQQSVSIESQFTTESPATPAATRQPHNTSLPAVVVTQSCQGCKALQVANQRINSTVTAMEAKLSKLSEMVTELNERLDQISKQKTSRKSSFRQSEEVFTDKRLMRIRAAAFLTGRPLSVHTCKQLVRNMDENEPPCTFNIDDIRLINDERECRDAQSLSKWAVFEMFSLQELVGRNCLGGGRDTAVNGKAQMKKPFDECKMEIIKNAVFQLYPQPSHAMRKAVWMKCVEKINSDVRYLFKVSLKKSEWLQLGL